MSVNTVLGQVEAEKLGLTLTHEHVSLEFHQFYRPPPKIYEDKFGDRIDLENVGFVRQYPYSSRINLEFNVPEAILEDVKLFAEAGGNTIVENTTWGLGRDLNLMKKISEATGVNIIAGTGHYVAECQKAETLRMSVEEMVHLMRTELTQGCIDMPEIKCGVVGEIASSWPIQEFEKRSIMAAAMIQSEINCPVTFHPARTNKAPFEIMRIFSEAGGNIKKAVMSHLDRTLQVNSELLEFSELGSFCQFDLFGIEVSFYQLAQESDMPSDAQRIDRIMALQEAGKQDNILISHDIHTRHRLVKYGGHGYAHIPVTVKPKMLLKGMSQENIDKILIHNPARWLTGQ